MRKQVITWHTFNDHWPHEEENILWKDRVDTVRVGTILNSQKFEDNESGSIYEVDLLDEWAYLEETNNREEIIQSWIGKEIKWLHKGCMKTGVITGVVWDELNDRPDEFYTTSGMVSLLVVHASQHWTKDYL